MGGVLLDAQKTVDEGKLESTVQARLGYTGAARKHANLKLRLKVFVSFPWINIGAFQA